MVAYGTETGQGILRWEGEAIRRNLLCQNDLGQARAQGLVRIVDENRGRSVLANRGSSNGSGSFRNGESSENIDVMRQNITFLGNRIERACVEVCTKTSHVATFPLD